MIAIVIVTTIMVALMPITNATRPKLCRPVSHFYHIGHGTVSGFTDYHVLDGFYEPVYTIRQNIARVKGQKVSALVSRTNNLYFIQSECRLQYQKGGMAVTITDIEKNITQILKYPMGFHQKPITLMSGRRQPVTIECVDISLFAFDILLKGSTQVVGRVRNMLVPEAVKRDPSFQQLFTLEVDMMYKDMTPFLIAVTLALDEYMYPATIDQRQKNCF